MAPNASPTRRTWCLGGVLAVVVLAAAGFWWTTRAPAVGPLVLISVDTLRADRLSVYGYRQGRTPALEEFSREAIRFDRAYAHAPQTLPSHASMLTGLLPFEHAVRDNLGFTLSDEAVTLPELLSGAQYRTAGFVSSFVLREETGIAQGFATYDAKLPSAASDRSPGQIQRPGLQTLEAVERWLAQVNDPRAFLFFHIYEPHKPYAPPYPHRDLPDPYDGEVAASDDVVGRLLAALRTRGWYDAATIVVTSDHGEGLGDHGELEHGLFLYDEVMRVPLLVKLPGGRHGGARRLEPVQHIDLMPTLLSIAGVPVPAGLRGRNLLPVLQGTGGLEPRGIYAEALYARYHFGWSELTSLTDERYRYIRAPREELYDLEQDPGEGVNIVQDRAAAAGALRNELAALVADRPLDAPSPVSDADRQRLAALGYVSGGPSPPTASAAALADPKDKAYILRMYRDAVDRLSAGQLHEGAKGLAAILQDDPNMTDVWSQYASTLVRLGRLPEAYAAWREVVARKPDEPSALLGAAAVLISLDRLAEAREYAEIAVTRAPAAAHQALANIAVTQGLADEARRHAGLAEAADPTLPMRPMIDGLLLYNEGDYAAAIPLLQQSLERFARRPIQVMDLHFYLGDALARLERYTEAEPLLRKEIRMYPQNTRARAGLAMLLAATGRVRGADRVLTEMMHVSPAPSSFELAADLYEMFGMPARAAAARQRR